MAWPGVAYFERDDAALDLVSTLLADGKNSRLVQTARVRRASGVGRECLQLQPRDRRPRRHRRHRASRRAAEPKLEELIDEEIRFVAKDGPTDEELERIKAGQEFDFLSGLERIGGFGGKADRLAMYQTFLGSPDFIEKDYDALPRAHRKRPEERRPRGICCSLI